MGTFSCVGPFFYTIVLHCYNIIEGNKIENLKQAAKIIPNESVVVEEIPQYYRHAIFI